MINLITLGFPGNPARDQPGWNRGHGLPLVSPRRSWQRDRADTSSSGLGSGAAVGINNAGDQARFLVNRGPENLVYPFRYHEGTWQQICFSRPGICRATGSARSTMR